MLKLLGALCVMTGAIRWGIQAVDALRRRRETLEELRLSLVWLEEELAFRLSPLPALLAELGRTRQGAAGQFFRAVLAGWEANAEGGVRQSWRRAMTCRLPMLRPEEHQALMEVGRVLGRYDAQSQRQVLAGAAERLAGFRDRAEGEIAHLGRVYIALSVAGGAAVVLVLI